MKRKIWSVTGVLAAVLAVGIVWLLQMGHLLPLWISWEHREIICTEEAAPETILLQNRSVSVRQGGKEIWRTQKDVKVQDVLWEDIDHDSEPELMLLCWKRGRYGESRPFWVTEDEKTWSQHIYLYDWKDGTFVPIWMASDIGREVICWSYDQRERLQLTDRDGETTAWDWVTWGLSRVPSTSVSFAAVGDNLIHRPIYDYGIRRENGNFDFLFENLRDELDRYDVTSINQETIYVEHPEDYSDYPRFGTPIEVGEAVIRAGFDMVSCATNHALDQGVDAIDRTVQLYEEAEVLCAGIQHSDDVEYRAYEVLERNGIRYAVFSYTQSTNGLPLPEDAPWSVHLLTDELQIRQDLLDAADQADFLIVNVHWGTEYAEEPDKDQLRWAQIFADCGVHVVIGTHPHVLQPVEWVTGVQGNETLVYYSLGNYISAQTDPACTIGGLAYYTVTKENGTCRISDYGLKKLVTEQRNGKYTTRLLGDG